MKNVYRILLIIMVIILILLSILICIKSKDLEKKEEYPPLSPIVEVQTVKEGTIIPVNSVDFFRKYDNARVESKEIYETINDFAKNIIPKYSSEISTMGETELKEYYEKSKNGSEDFIEAETFEEFKRNVEYAKNISSNAKLVKISFDSESVEVKDNYITAKIVYEFDDYSILNYNLKIYNYKTEQGKFIYFYM